MLIGTFTLLIPRNAILWRNTLFRTIFWNYLIIPLLSILFFSSIMLVFFCITLTLWIYYPGSNFSRFIVCFHINTIIWLWFPLMLITEIANTIFIIILPVTNTFVFLQVYLLPTNSIVIPVIF